MLSQDLTQMAQNFESLSAAGSTVTITSDAARGIAAYFRALAEQAAALEGCPVPAAARGDLPTSVVRLSDARAARDECRAFAARPMPMSSPDALRHWQARQDCPNRPSEGGDHVE